MKILVKYPSRGRPKLFWKTLEGYLDKMSCKHYVQFLFSFDNDDQAMKNEEITSRLDGLWDANYNLSYHYGNSKSKIQACNADIEKAKCNWQVLILVSDDMECVTQGWDDVVAKDMEKYFPDQSGGLWYPDGRQKRLCTLSIMGRKLYDYYGYVYHPDYKSQWCDNEFHETATQLGKLQFIDNVIIKHQWCKNQNGKIEKDELFIKNAAKVSEDKQLFAKRKELNFPKYKETV